jgi:tRNA A37 threonylcarbamoyltransferase TsaD
MDLSYSGILSDIKRRLSDGADMKALCLAVQEVSFAMLTEVTERAMAHTQKQDALLVGGVAANKRLFEMVATMAHERGGDAYVVPREYAGDNGTMIALVGEQMYETGIKEGIEESFTTQRFRTDEVEVTWV